MGEAGKGFEWRGEGRGGQVDERNMQGAKAGGEGSGGRGAVGGVKREIMLFG